jgi:carbon-monoxide dehydrogenase medium subunit/2-furoyl-CoA dehydrogenase FAD binding subunit
MKPPLFDMVRPRAVDDALRLLAANPDSKVIAGGQSLVPVMNFRLAAPSLLIDLNQISELAGIRYTDGMLRVGAMTRQQRLLESPLIREHALLLQKALSNVGHVQTRSRGTIGGSLVHADPSAELPLVAVTLDAMISVRSHSGERTVPARTFFTAAMTTDLASDEIVTEIAIPCALTETRAVFKELARRHGDFAIVAVAAQLAEGRLTIAVGGLEASPRLCTQVMDECRGGALDRSHLASVIHTELADALPLGDLQADGEYRRYLAAILMEDVLGEVFAS